MRNRAKLKEPLPERGARLREGASNSRYEKDVPLIAKRPDNYQQRAPPLAIVDRYVTSSSISPSHILASLYLPMGATDDEVEHAEEYLFKIVLIGDAAVGKSNLLSRYARNEFSLNSKPTIGVEFQTQTMIINGKEVKAQIWDTAGQERFRAVTSAYYRGAVGALVVYDISSRQSFDNIGRWLEELRMHADAGAVTMLIGNKSDLGKLRQVKVEEGAALAAAENLFFMETSALEAINASEAFQCCVKEIYNSLCRKVLAHESPNTEISLKESVTLLGGASSKRFDTPCCST